MQGRKGGREGRDREGGSHENKHETLGHTAWPTPVPSLLCPPPSGPHAGTHPLHRRPASSQGLTPEKQGEGEAGPYPEVLAQKI